MPAAAVIPAPIAYIKVVAVKTLVVELGARRLWSASRRVLRVSGSVGCAAAWCVLCQVGVGPVYFEEIRVFKAGACAGID